MAVLAKFKLSPNGDSAAFNGSFALSSTAVPAPPALALFALGVLATAIARRSSPVRMCGRSGLAAVRRV